MSAKPNTKIASLYSIASNRSLAIEDHLNTLSSQAVNGDIRGMTYALTDGKGELIVGRMGSHDGNDDQAIASLFRCAVALTLTA